MSWIEHAQSSEGLDNILASHSLNPAVLEAHVALNKKIMFGPSGLSRLEREAMAVCVSAANDCITVPRSRALAQSRHFRMRSSPVGSRSSLLGSRSSAVTRSSSRALRRR